MVATLLVYNINTHRNFLDARCLASLRIGASVDISTLPSASLRIGFNALGFVFLEISVAHPCPDQQPIAYSDIQSCDHIEGEGRGPRSPQRRFNRFTNNKWIN